MTANPPFRLIWEGEWNDIPCSDYPLTPERWVEEELHPLLNTGVDCLTYNLCSSDGFVCELEHGELLMRSVEKFDDAWCWRYRENTKRLIEAGANPPRLAVEFGRRYGLAVIPVVRMNDPHDQFFAFEWSDFKRAHPEYLLGEVERVGLGFRPTRELTPETIESVTWGMFDFKHQAVRDRKLRIIEEFVTRWDNDGVMLDFDRDPYFFHDGSRPENQALMTDLVRQTRQILDRIEKERGKRQHLIARVLGDIDLTTQRGLDVRTWVREGLVQILIPGAGYLPLTLDIAPWLELVGSRSDGHECWIYPSNNHWKTTEQSRAWASAMYHAGAHGLYLFNYGHLLWGHPAGATPQAERTGTVWYGEVHPDYYRALNEIGDARTIAYLNKSYALESAPRDGRGAHQRPYRGVDAPLPWTLGVGTHDFRIPIGDDPPAARARGLFPRATLRTVVNNYTVPDRFHVLVNGTRLDDDRRTTRATFIMNNDSRISYPVPAELLRPGVNTIQFVVESTNPQMARLPVLKALELDIDYRAGPPASADQRIGKD